MQGNWKFLFEGSPEMDLNSLLRNSSYELTENGVNLKVFGIAYPCTEEQLNGAIHFLIRLLERVQMIRREKKDLERISPGD